MVIDGIEVTVTGGEAGEKELREYIARGKAKYGDRLTGVEVEIDGNYVGLRYKTGGGKFERIRRITGYLVGTMDKWNDAKRAEEHDRVKHGEDGLK